MRVVSEAICGINNLRFQERLAPLRKLLDRGVVSTFTVHGNRLANFSRQVQPGKVRIAVFELVYNPKSVQVVLETAMTSHALIERGFPRVAERGMTQVM